MMHKIFIGASFQENKEKTEYWKASHRQFLAEHPKGAGITAVGCGHYIWEDNPNLVIQSITESYSQAKQ